MAGNRSTAEVHPPDPQQFDEYYQNVHLPIAERMQGATLGYSLEQN
ncbi:hypothetical protein [Nocardia vaccinii]|nr:hypothetical protein [Nocardia vaccinii]